MKIRLNHPLSANFFSLAAYQGINYLLPLLSIPFLSRMLGDTYFGLYAFGWAVSQYLVMVTDFGFNLSATKYISIHREDAQTINKYLNAVYLARILLGILCFLVLIVLVLFVNKFKGHALFFLLFFGVVLGNIMTPLWFFQGMEKMKYMTIFNIVAKLTSFLPMFVVIRSEADYLWVPIFFSIGYIFAGIISLYIVYVKEKMRCFFPDIKDVWYALKDSSSYFLSRLSSSMFSYVNVLVLGMATTYETVGFYAKAEKLYQAYNQLLTPVTGVLFPHIAKTKDIPFFKKIYRIISRVNIPLIALLFVGAPLLMWLIYGDYSPETVDIFRILICACLFTVPSMLLGYPFLAALGHATYVNYTIIIVSVIHLLCIVLLFTTGMMSIYTMAAMTVVSELLLFLFRYKAVIKYKLFK